MDDIAQRLFRFEDFTLDVLRRRLRRGGEDLDLRPKSFDVLCCLLENAGRVVSKEEIIAAVWPNVTVTDESLTRCVSDVRLLLGDGEQRLIKTVPRRGYFFAAPVSTGPTTSDAVAIELTLPNSDPVSGAVSSPATAVAASNTAFRRWAWLGAIVIALPLLLVLAHWSWQQAAGLALPDRPSIAVMPFINMSGSHDDYFMDGISEDLMTSLSRFGDLFVIARDSAFQYKGRYVDPKQVGRELGVRYLLQGSVRRDGERLRITAQLVDTASGKQLWGEAYDRPDSGVFAVQDEVTQKIIVTLVARVTKSEIQRISHKPVQSLPAYDAYLRANALIRNMDRDRATVNAARALYEQAITADANFAPAYQGLAHVQFLLWGIPCPEQPARCEFHQPAVLDRAEALAQRSVDLDGSRAEAHAMLAWVFNFQNRYDKALAAYQRAFQLNPNYAEGRYGLFLSHAGHASEAIDYMKRIMRLDPLCPPVYVYWLGKGYFFTGQYDTAIDLIRSAAQRIPGHLTSRVLLATAAAHMGRDEEARAAAAEALRIDPSLTIASWLKFMRLARDEDVERLASGMRKAGIPE